MEIEVMEVTSDPVDLISRAMGTCYGKDDTSQKRVERAYIDRHMSVFEHAKATVRITGVSRALTHQLVRHRMASFCQESQRYCKIDVDNDDWYVTPPTFDNRTMVDWFWEDWTFKECYDACMVSFAEFYLDALEKGIPAEDARYLLPNACKTTIVMTMNVRELYHFFHLRDDSHAQWEIRDLARLLRKTLSETDGQWKFLMILDK